MDFNERDFKDCAGSFATGVTVVTTLNDKAKPVGITINSFASLSLHPPLVLFCLDKASKKISHFMNEKHFAINILSENQEAISRHFSLSGHRWEDVDFSSGSTNCPILPGILAYIECQKETVYEGGDHFIFIGKVLNLKRCLNDGKPLLYYQGRYTH